MKITKGQLKRIVEQSMRYDMGSDVGDAAVAASPNKKELQALSGAFTVQVTLEDVPYIQYQPKKRGGVVTSLSLTDMGEQLGHMQTAVTEQSASQYGTTVDAIWDFLSKNGARLQKRAPKRKTGAGHSYSYYD